MATDAIVLLLQDKQSADAQKLLEFHRAHSDFLPSVVSELRWLKRMERKAGGVKTLIHFLRWEKDWEAVEEFAIDDHLSSFTARVCALLWPDINGMLRFHHCEADDVLKTKIRRRGKRYGNFLYAGMGTLCACCTFLPPRKDANGQMRPIQHNSLGIVLPPDVPVINRAPTVHELISESDAALVVEPLERIAANSARPRHPLMRAWVRHFQTQPEIFAFMEGTLEKRQPQRFSAKSILEYARWSIRRAAESYKRFTLPGQLEGMYCRALIMCNPELNGRCEFRESASRTGLSNQLLRCTLSEEPIKGEPHRRLRWESAL